MMLFTCNCGMGGPTAGRRWCGICRLPFKQPPVSRPLTWRRHRAQDNLLTVLITGLCWLIKNSATGAAHGHRTLYSWLVYDGERSRADGWRALAAIGYVGLWACVAGVMFALFLMAVLM
jgi:hypothetical protein